MVIEMRSRLKFGSTVIDVDEVPDPQLTLSQLLRRSILVSPHMNG